MQIQSGQTVQCVSKHALCFFFLLKHVSQCFSVWRKSVEETLTIIPAHFHLLEPQPKQTTWICFGFGSFSLVSAQQRWCRALEMRERERTRCGKPNSAREWDFYNLSPSWPGSMKTLSLNLWLLTHWAFLTTECKYKSLRTWNYRQ